MDIPAKRPAILPLLNIDNNQTKLEYKSGLLVAGYPVNLLKRKAWAKQPSGSYL